MVKKVIFQRHHPSRELFPGYTIKLRKWIHLWIRRLEQFKPTKSNIDELERVVRAVNWIYNLKKMELENKGENNDGQGKDG